MGERSPNKKRRRSESSDGAATPVVLNSGTVQYHCDYCQTDLSDTIRIKCAVCVDFDLCVECFSVGVETAIHKCDHDYHVMERMNFPLFDGRWGAEEETLLLEGIDMFGFGNWSEIAEHVGTKFLEECKEHYFDTYIKVPTYPLPDLSKPPPAPIKLEDMETRIELLKKKTEAPKVKPSLPVQSNGSGYMPLRGEFETEWHNDAEQVFKAMHFDDDKYPEYTALKIKVLHVYNQVLTARMAKRKFVLDNDLLDIKKKQQDRGKTKEDRNMYNVYRLFLQLWDRERHENFIKGLISERNLVRRIHELQEYRRNGIHTFSDADQFEEGKRRRTNESIRKARENVYSIERGTTRGSKWLQRDAQQFLGYGDKRKLRRLPLDISGADGVGLLSASERELCSHLRVYPQQYLLVKESLLKENLRCGGKLSKQEARTLVKLDISKTGRIYEFFVSSGWINVAGTRSAAASSTTSSSSSSSSCSSSSLSTSSSTSAQAAAS